MTPERWQKVEELFHAALSRPLEEQSGFLNEACVGDESLRREVDDLLACDRAPDGSLTGIASGVAVGWLRENECDQLIGRCFDKMSVRDVFCFSCFQTRA